MKAWLQNFHNPFKKVKNIGFHKKPNPGTLQSAHIGFRNTHISKVYYNMVYYHLMPYCTIV